MLCLINKKIQELLSRPGEEKRPQKSSTDKLAISIDEALSKLQQSNENAAETIASTFKACHGGLEKFKATVLENLVYTNDCVYDMLRDDLVSSDENAALNAMETKISYNVDDSCYKDVMGIFEKYFTIKMTSSTGNSSSNEVKEEEERHKYIERIYLDDLLSLLETNEEKINVMFLMK